MPDDTPDIDASQDSRLAALEAEAKEARDHRTVVKTLLGMASAAALLVILGAVTVRDTTLDTARRVTAVEVRQTESEVASRARDTDDRSTRETLIRLTATIEALRAQVEGLRSEMQGRRSPTP